MKIKFFKIEDEQQINDFLAENRVLQDGIRIHADSGMVSIGYADGLGITKKDLINMLNAELTQQQQNKLSAEAQRRNWLAQEVSLPNGATQAKRDEAEGNRHKAEEGLAEAEQAIHQIRDLISDVESGQFTV
jgi:G3E family GTPase